MNGFRFLLISVYLCFGNSEETLNIYGEALSPCSSEGMARTGYMRDGQCGSTYGDYGSHHVCIDLQSVTGGNFCTVTGQPNWCNDSMPCHENSTELCPVQHWCVCQWAFASYVKKAGGCDKIQAVVCDSINIKAIDAYESSTNPDHIAALACLEEKCAMS